MDVANIVVGAPSSISIGAAGAAEGACVALGATDGGLKLNFNPEFYFKKADQYLGKVGAVKTGEDLRIEVVLPEVSLANVCMALGYPVASVSGSTLNIGGLSTVTERVAYINGNAVSGGTMKITLHKCVVVGAVEFNMEKDNNSKVKLTLQILEDTSKSAGERYGSIVYSGTDTTPPTVALSSPVEDGTVVGGASTVVQVTFTEATNAIDENTLVQGRSVMVINTTDQAAVVEKAGTISYNAGTKVLTFTPTAPWTASNKFQILITREVKDTAGNALAATYIGNFTATA